ncbi:MAG: GspE/PulE family protein [Oscillospiraceae bacterium]
MTHKRLGDLLLSIGLITEDQLAEALAIQKKNKDRLGRSLINQGFITEAQLTDVLKMQLGIDSIDLTKIIIPTEMAHVLSKNIARKYGVVPVKVNKDTLYLAMSDPLNFMAIEEVKSATRKKVVPMISTMEATERAIMTLYGNEGAARAIEEMKRETQEEMPDASYSSTDIGEDAQSAPTIRLVNSIIERAVTESASDIHLEPHENELRVRMRIDGLMRNILTVPRNLQSSVISRLKIMGSMDISERKIPQDGRANIRAKNKNIDLRISTLPTIYGEKIVIRLLDKDSNLLDKGRIGLVGDDLEKYMSLISNHSGVVLIVGPTGSGKSSTMYTMIKELNTEQVNLITLEDPVEYDISGVNQVQINEKTGMTFANGLRAILRQDPDIIAVGEIRDGETAEIAMRAAMTGHLVLSTMHTNDAISTIDRLMDIGVEPYLIAGAVKGVISQRLVRKACTYCRAEYEPADQDLAYIGIERTPEMHFYHGTGCPHCFHTGYRGRTGVFEVLFMTRDLRSAISARATREEYEKVMRQGNFNSLADNCRRLVLEGVTTVEEAHRTITSSDI